MIFVKISTFKAPIEQKKKTHDFFPPFIRLIRTTTYDESYCCLKFSIIYTKSNCFPISDDMFCMVKTMGNWESISLAQVKFGYPESLPTDTKCDPVTIKLNV